MNDARSKATVAKLLDATLVCLARDGYARLSVATITAEAGLSRGALFHHFDTKTELSAHAAASFLRARQERLRDLAATLDPAQRSIASRLQMLRHESERDEDISHEIRNAMRTDAILRNLVQTLDIPTPADEKTLYSRIFPEAVRHPDGPDIIVAAIVFLRGLAAEELPSPEGRIKDDHAERIFRSFRDMFVERLSQP